MLDNKYIDIINLPHHESKKYPRMTIQERTAQFAPFAAISRIRRRNRKNRKTNTKLKDEINIVFL
ncbi:MAG: hypothetical protein J5507_02710 [Clostridia bacterium]|nr:hypothetical protein [Clostridia bacterium]